MTTADDPFVRYYAEASTSAATIERFKAVYDLLERVRRDTGDERPSLEVADVGCGPGAQCLIWARKGHRVHGLDINAALIDIARERAQEQGIALDLRVGSAVALPWADASMDICLLPEVLEHVPEWQACLDEAMRILKPGGLLYISTANYLCPVQMEFDLPMYGWYPKPLKRYFERRSVTDWPELVNHAKYPAVNWFSFYSLRRYIAKRGFECRDRFQVINLKGRSAAVGTLLRVIKSVPLLRWFGQVATPGVVVIARRLCLAFAALLGLGLAQSPTASAGVLDALPPGHWYEVPNSKLRSLDPCPKRDCSYSAVEGLSAVIDDWNGGAFATRFGANGGYIVFGGGHKGYFGNELYVFDVAELKWQRVTEPVLDPVCDYAEGELQDGSPCSAHTYDYVDYHPKTNSFVMLGSASNHVQGGGGAPRVHLFSFDTKQWRRGARRENFYEQTGASSAYDSNRDVFWLLAPYRNWLAKYDPNAKGGAGAWTNEQNFHIEIDAVAAIDPIHDLYVALEGRERHKLIVFDLKNPQSEPVIVKTEGDAMMQEAKGHGFEWDPRARAFVGWAGGTSVYLLEPPEKKWQSNPWKWSRIEAAADNHVSPGPENERGTYSRWRYVPDKDLWIVVNSVDANVFFYRLNKPRS